MKVVSFYAERFQRRSALKTVQFFGPSCVWRVVEHTVMQSVGVLSGRESSVCHGLDKPTQTAAQRPRLQLHHCVYTRTRIGRSAAVGIIQHAGHHFINNVLKTRRGAKANV